VKWENKKNKKKLILIEKLLFYLLKKNTKSTCTHTVNEKYLFIKVNSVLFFRMPRAGACPKIKHRTAVKNHQFRF
jgi:hypothetical protein